LSTLFVVAQVTPVRLITPEDSGIDLAVEQIEPANFFNAISAFSRYLDREVDLVELKNCHFA